VTSEVLGSMRCDCKEQLELSLDYIHKHGGVVIYMQQVRMLLHNTINTSTYDLTWDTCKPSFALFHCARLFMQ
jgi:GTP cyclohydrolase II